MLFELLLAFVVGLLGLFVIIAGTAFISDKIGGYFTYPLLIIIIVSVLSAFTYHSILKPRLEITVSKNAVNVERRRHDSLDDLSHYLLDDELNLTIDLNPMIDELKLSNNKTQCRLFDNNQFEVCIIKKGWW